MTRSKLVLGLLILGLAGWAIAQTPLGPGTYTLPPGSTIVVPTPPPTSYTLGVTVAGPGVGTAGPGGTYPSGQVVPLTNAPASGSTFAGWSGDADCADGSVTMTANRACVATFALVPPPVTSALGQLAASMAPGAWAPLQTQGISALYATGSSSHIVGDASKAVWDPAAKQLHFIGSDHGDLQQHVVYDEATNTWSRQPRAAWMPTTTGTPWHGYQHTAIDPVGRKLWHRPYANPIVRELDLTTKVWRDLPTFVPSHLYGTVCCATIVWFPERAALQFIALEGTTGGVSFGTIAEYRPATGAWTRLTSGFPLIHYVTAEYVTARKAVVFGAGTVLHQVDQAGVVTRLPDATFAVSNTGRHGELTHDPASGDLLAYADRTNWAVFSWATGSWAVKTTPDAEVIGPPRYTGMPLFGHVVASVPTHGVNLWVRCHYADTPDKCRVWLYKHGTTVVQLPPVNTADADFKRRCESPGVFQCVGFDSEAQIRAGHPGYTWPNRGIAFDPMVKASGAGSMQCPVEPGTSYNGYDLAGVYSPLVHQSFCAFRFYFMPGGISAPVIGTSPRPAGNVVFKPGDDMYIQWRQRFDPEFITVKRGDGWKQLIIADPAVGSCLRLDLVMTHGYYRGIPRMYHSCGAKDGAYEGLDEPTPLGNFRLQNAIRDASTPPSPDTNCLYSPQRQPPCIAYVPNEWMTFQIRVKIGTYYQNDKVYKHDSIVQAWVARQGQPSVLAWDFSPKDPACTAVQKSLPSCQTGYDLLQPTEVNQYTGERQEGLAGLWFTNLDWRMLAETNRPLVNTWYDEAIVSRQRIPDPS